MICPIRTAGRSTAAGLRPIVEEGPREGVSHAGASAYPSMWIGGWMAVAQARSGELITAARSLIAVEDSRSPSRGRVVT